MSNVGSSYLLTLALSVLWKLSLYCFIVHILIHYVLLVVFCFCLDEVHKAECKKNNYSNQFQINQIFNFNNTNFVFTVSWSSMYNSTNKNPYVMVQLHLAGLPSTTTNVFTDTILIRPIVCIVKIKYLIYLKLIWVIVLLTFCFVDFI
jgi:hypothetical protein